jgi:hypothetical protein
VNRLTSRDFSTVVVGKPISLYVGDMAFDVPQTVFSAKPGTGHGAGVDMVTVCGAGQRHGTLSFT